MLGFWKFLIYFLRLILFLIFNYLAKPLHMLLFRPFLLGLLFSPLLALSQQSVVSFTLINADTDQDIRQLVNNDTITFSQLPTRNLNVRANTNPFPVGSVSFDLNASINFRTESGAPYSLAGDNAGNYAPWTPPLGNNTLKCTPYTGANRTGAAGTPLTIVFFVRDSVNSGSVGGGGGAAGGSGQVTVTGQFKRWHQLDLNLSGPLAKEDSAVNPFSDYRFDVIFKKGSRTLRVPGFFAADGNAANTSATKGNVWRCIFRPDEVGTWTYRISFRTGTDVTATNDTTVGVALAPYNGITGSITVTETDKMEPDFRAKGFLRPVASQHYHRFQDGEYFIKAGPNSPENFLGYYEFDNTVNTNSGNYITAPSGLHHYNNHLQDWQTGDPTWQNGEGKRIIGAVNYIASKGLNTIYFIVMKNGGTGDVHPWTGFTDYDRYDVSKLGQWDIVFNHMNKKGILIHFLFSERQNSKLLNNGDLGRERKIYYREMVARFGHHLVLQWNEGEENRLTAAQRTAVFAYMAALDPYGHPQTIHNNIGTANGVLIEDSLVFNPHLGDLNMDGTSIQGRSINDAHALTLKWRNKSNATANKWAVCIDEPHWQTPALRDGAGNNHPAQIREVLWGNLLGGGAGIEWYMGATDDWQLEDWRSRDSLFSLSRIGLDFFRTYLFYWEMSPADNLTSRADDFVFAKNGQTYALFLEGGGTASLNLAGQAGTYNVFWFDPIRGGDLQTGSVLQVAGGSSISIGNPPSNPTADWVALVQRTSIPFPNRTPVARFTYTPAAGVAPFAATFNGTTSYDPDGTIASYSWNFGDGGTGTGATRSHTYMSAGVYNVTLTVTDDDGAMAILVQELRVYAPGTLPPFASFTATPNTSNVAPVTAQFNAAASTDLDGTIQSYLWDFGDGYVAQGQQVTHTYGWEADFTARLIVVDNHGNRDTATTVIAVDDPCISSAGTILREWWNGIGGASVSDLTSNIRYPSQPDGAEELPAIQGPYSFGEDYGTRIRGYIQPAVTGSYTFTATGDDGTEVYLSTNSNPANKALIANIPGWTNFDEFNKFTSQNSSPITLTAGQKYYVEILHKEGGGGDHVTLYWIKPGSTVREIIRDQEIWPFTTCTKQLPTNSFTANTYSGQVPMVVQFTSTASDPDGTIASRLWDFGDNGSATSINPAHTFNTPGVYTVRFTVVDNDGLRSLATRTITVTGNPLPVEWLAVSAAQEQERVRISWSAAFEAPGDHYLVERAETGTGFVSVATADGKGDGDVHSYEAYDESPMPGINTYRVIQWDINGAAHYSPKVEAFFASGGARVYPVPARRLTPLNVEFTAFEAEPYTITLTNSLGQVVYRHSGKATEGKFIKQINTHHLPGGVYMLRLHRIQDGTVFVEKISVSR